MERRRGIRRCASLGLACGLALLASIASGCHATRWGFAPAADAEASVDMRMSDGMLDTAEIARTKAPAGAFYADAPARAAGGELPPLAPKRKRIYTAQLTLEVARPDDELRACVTHVDSLGGWLSRRDGTTVTVRLPAEHFDAFLTWLEQQGRVLSRSMQANDVTERWADLRIRLDNASRSRDRLLALLEKADKVEDLLKIEEQLRRLSTEIESLEGQLKYLDDQIAHSTVTVTYVSTAADGPRPQRRPSRFDWINAMGVEHVLRMF